MVKIIFQRESTITSHDIRMKFGRTLIFLEMNSKIRIFPKNQFFFQNLTYFQIIFLYHSMQMLILFQKNFVQVPIIKITFFHFTYENLKFLFFLHKNFYVFINNFLLGISIALIFDTRKLHWICYKMAQIGSFCHSFEWTNF